MKRFAILLFVTALLPGIIVAQEAQEVLQAEAPAVQPEEKAEVTEVVVLNQKFEEAQLEGSFQYVASAVGKHLKGATYKVDGNKLLVGVRHEILKDGAELAKIKFRSDCPDNSQFRVQESILEALNEKAMKEILVAWTRFRHDAPDAKLRVVNISQWADGKNFDVQLNIDKVALR